ncbi:hypothetical protein [Methylobacterium iners]|uniref:Uncharacterized protein n=1 Tax=Methylobacterium iners TaxID=418707 RepID=A0ABQ4S0Z3_9HYPH|nr:hypothetical protein [Methylobacterium iners]GJD96656.1 hypothetical protein OCOJLMKI_3879 [Methylobacterium iners]
MITNYYGTELTPIPILRWCPEFGVEWHCVAPGKPIRWAFMKLFNDVSEPGA